MKKLTFLCSFGGDFGGDHHRYVGGDTRLVSIDRRGDVTLPRLLSKLSSIAAPHSFKLVKYQLRESSSLVPIASDDDVRRMVEDYDVLAAAGSLCRLRIFLCDVKPRNPRFTPLSLGDSNHQKRVLAKDAHGNKLRVSRGCRKSPTLSGFAAGASPRQNLFPNYMTETCSGRRSFVGNCQHSRVHHQSMTKTNKFSPDIAETSRIDLNDFGCKRRDFDSRLCMPKCHLGSRPSAYGLPSLTKKQLRTKPLDYVHPYLHRKNGQESSSDTSRPCGLESPSDISMHQLSLISSVRACPQLPHSSASSDIHRKHIATSPRQIEQLQPNKGEDGFHSVSKINKSMKVSDAEAALFQGQVSVDMKNEAAYTWKDQETTSSTSNVEEKANGAVTSICFEGAGKTSCDLLSRYALLADQGLQTIHESDLEQMKELGSGAFGTVFYGKWKGSDVAIKRLKPACFSGAELEDKLVSDFWKEARLLSQLHHPNVLAFYGVVTDGPMAGLATVTEYMVNGSLKQVLQRKDRTIDRRKRVIIAMNAAFGMEYLHDKKIVHFDLKSRNLLVNIKDPHRPVCKIGDLGLSKVKRRTLVSGGVRGTIPWMAPELLSSENMVTDKVDVYSFGIVMWELLTGEEPYQNMRSQEIIGGMLEGSLRPEIPSWCDPAWRSLMERCWSSDPGLRPSFSEIAKELRAIAASMNIK